MIDTNLLLLLTIGTYDRGRIETHKRTRSSGFTTRDYDLLRVLIEPVSRRLTTPNILTEVDNLSRQTADHEHAGISEALARLIETMFEIYEPSLSIVSTSPHRDFGLTDSILIAQSAKSLIVTADFRLAGKIASIGMDAINYNHLRPSVM